MPKNLSPNPSPSLSHMLSLRKRSQNLSSSQVITLMESIPGSKMKKTGSSITLGEQKYTNEFDITFSVKDFVVIGLTKRPVMMGGWSSKGNPQKNTRGITLACFFGPNKSMLTKLQRDRIDKIYRPTKMCSSTDH